MAEKKPVTEMERVRKAALEQLAILGGSTLTTEDDVVYEGTKFVLPTTMHGNLAKAISFLEKKLADDEQPYGFNHQFNYRPWDGAVATANVLRKLFGMTLGKPIAGMFGSSPPQLIDVHVSVTETVQAPWGAMSVPGLENTTIYMDSTGDAKLGMVFFLHGEGPRKYRHIIDGLFKAIEAELAENSIYRGKAITGEQTPTFLDLSNVDPDSVVYSQTVLDQLNAEVWVPIEQADKLADLGEPSKRTVIFEGPYGTGKTLGAYLTAMRAVDAGWTFIMARPGRDDLSQVLQTARMYQPAVVFTEDIDTAAGSSTGGPEYMSRVLDMFDGLDTKGLRLITVLTTNNVETLHPGMLRPGRLDAVISIGLLDVAGVRKLATYVFGDKLADDVDWEAVHEANADYTPAFMREGFGRVVRYQLARGDHTTVTTHDLVAAAESLRFQHNLMLASLRGEEPDTSFTDIVRDAVRDVVNDTVLVDSDSDISQKVVSAPGLRDKDHYQRVDPPNGTLRKVS